jgi:hypothetical protein
VCLLEIVYMCVYACGRWKDIGVNSSIGTHTLNLVGVVSGKDAWNEAMTEFQEKQGMRLVLSRYLLWAVGGVMTQCDV